MHIDGYVCKDCETHCANWRDKNGYFSILFQENYCSESFLNPCTSQGNYFVIDIIYAHVLLIATCVCNIAVNQRCSYWGIENNVYCTYYKITSVSAAA